MVKQLQKITLGLFVSAFLALALVVQTNAQDFEKKWSASVADENLPDWFTEGMTRGIEFYDGKLYLPDRNTNTIRVLDAETGEELDSPFDLDGVEGGLFPINDLKISEDGILFLGNLTTNAGTSAFKLYWWDDLSGTFTESLTIDGEEGERLGDHFSVVGSEEDGSLEVWMPVAGSNPGKIYVAKINNSDLLSLDTITLSGSEATAAIGTGAHAVPFFAGGESDFYVAGNSSSPMRYNSDGEYIEGTAFPSASRSGFRLFGSGDTEYMAIYSYRGDGAPGDPITGRFFLYDITDPTDFELLETSDFLGDASGISVSGDVAVSIDEEGNINLYAVDTVNGIVAYTYSAAPDVYIDEPANLFFSEYIEGSSNNKALEIYNNSGEEVNLTNYQIAQTTNGSDWRFFESFKEGAVIGNGEVYTLGSDAIFDDLFDINDLDEIVYYPGPVYHTGDDARALIHIDPVSNDTTWLDLFGGPNDAPDGPGWPVAGVENATTDHTLIRKPSVTEGNPVAFASFGTNVNDSEWIVMPMNFFGNLGKPSSELAAPLEGDFFIPEREGDDQGFESLSQAFAAINEFGLTGPTNLYITDDIDENADLTLNRNDLTEDTPLLIKPAEGVSPTITLIAGPGTDGIWLNQADYVTFDGSNTDGGDTRDLTFTSDDPSMTTMVYVYETVNSTFKNANFYYTGENSINAFVPNESGSVGTRGWSIINNTIGSEDGDFKTAIGLWGWNEGVEELKDTKVIDNDIYTTHRGITSWWATNNDIIGNTITLANPIEDQAWYGTIYLALNNGETNIIGNTIKVLQVNRTETPTYAAGILFNASLGEVNIYNNMISAEDFHNVGDAEGNQVFGIGINNAAGNSVNKVYHNSIRMGENDETGTQAAFGLITVGSSDQEWDFKNNLFTVDNDAENASVYRIPVDFDFESDYNNFQFGDNSYLSTMGSAEEAIIESTDFATWITDSGYDENSTKIDVEFVSGSDLRLTGESIGDVNLAGTPLADVTTDVDGNQRSEVAPYKGAFEGEAFDVAAEIDDKPLAYSLSQNYPNPFNPTSNIQFTLPQNNHVRIDVYNINGQLVQTLVNTNMTAGEHTVTFNARNLASGVYIYRIVAGNFVQSKRMTLIK